MGWTGRDDISCKSALKNNKTSMKIKGTKFFMYGFCLSSSKPSSVIRTLDYYGGV